MGTEGSTVLEPLGQKIPSPEAGTLHGSASCALPSQYEAVGSAREFTGRTLGRWGLSREYDGVALVVSELATNALRHGLPAAGGTATEPPVRLHLLHWPARLLCAVRDPSAAPPVASERSAAPLGVLHAALDPDAADEELPVEWTSESGRGLHLVESFSDSWGWHRLSGALPGKVVWALFRLGPG